MAEAKFSPEVSMSPTGKVKPEMLASLLGSICLKDTFLSGDRWKHKVDMVLITHFDLKYYKEEPYDPTVHTVDILQLGKVDQHQSIYRQL